MKNANRARKTKWLGIAAAGVVSGAICVLTMVASVEAGEMRWPVGLSYVAGFTDVTDRFEKNLGGHTTVTATPVGINIQPYYEFDIGIRIGAGVGPLMMIFGDATFFDVPLNLHLGYALPLGKSAALYARGGVAYNLALGDYVQGSSPGLFAAGGVEFMRTRRVRLAIEAGVNNAEIELDANSRGTRTTKIKPIGFTAGFFVNF